MSEHTHTPGPWRWNSYSEIFAEVPLGSELDDWDQEYDGAEGNINGMGLAHIAWVCQAPKYRGHGDELHHPETVANAYLIKAAPTLLDTLRALWSDIERAPTNDFVAVLADRHREAVESALRKATSAEE